LSLAVRLLAASTAVAACWGVAACDDSTTAQPPAQTATAPAAGPSAVDTCLVGTWKSTNITGSFTLGGALVRLAGGAGEVLTIDGGGRIKTDDSNTTPVGGSGPDGAVYLLVQSGTATGTIASAQNRITVTLDQPTTLTVTLYKNGNAVQRQHPGSAHDTYACAPRVSLVITGGGGTVTRYVPA
jgi:hypothetical protein